MTEDVDPDDPRPAGHYHADRDADWRYVDDDLAETIILGPATDGEPGDDWILTFSAATATDDPAPAERVAVRLTPWALHELYIETKDLSPDARQAGHTAECGLCGEQVDLEKGLAGQPERTDPSGLLGSRLRCPTVVRRLTVGVSQVPLGVRWFPHVKYLSWRLGAVPSVGFSLKIRCIP